MIEFQKELKIPKFEGIGVSLAGIVDCNRENIIVFRYMGISNMHVGDYIKKYFPDVPNIQFENNANASALV